MTAHESPGEGAAPEALQLDTAEPLAETAATTCAGCKRVLLASYFTIGPQIACGACRDAVVARLAAREGESFGRGLLFGLGAAAVGSAIYFAVAKISGYEIALVGILTGYLVGRAVRQGSRSLGGRRYQVLAVVLTYVAITTSYVPTLWQAVAAKHAAAPEAAAETPAPAPSDAVAPAPSSAETPVRVPAQAARPLLLQLVLALFVFGLALVAPLLAGVSNFLGWVIIGFSVWEAWKRNRLVEIPIRGPFRVGAPGTAAGA